MRWRCDCGLDHDQHVPACGSCLAVRPERPERQELIAGRCQPCGEEVGWNRLTTGEDGTNRCASCHVVYLRHRMEQDGDQAAIQAERERFRAILAGSRWATRFGGAG